MRTYSVVIFSLLVISSIVLVSSFESSFAEEIIVTSVGFEDSTILELKNSRGNTVYIDTVRIWLSEDNEFKSFKTEQGWMGKNTPQGVIVFTSQNEISPGEGVKFGIKTTKQNPSINWKAVDKNGEVISSAKTKTTNLEINDPGLNDSKVIGIKDESVFRFIPEKPTSDSDFRIVGTNFVPKQSLDFYIGNEFKNTIKVDEDGKILFTSKTPVTINEERTEFILRDSGGNEKILSMRISESDKREISEIVKLSIDNTSKDVKRGEVVNLTGLSTPNSTITITLKHSSGDILHIDTIAVQATGQWNYESLFASNLDLGTVSIEIDDGKSRILRDFQIISAELINVFAQQTMYQSGDTVSFSGKAIPNQVMSISLENETGAEIFSRSISVGETGNVDFDIPISRDDGEGTYILHLYQGDEEGISTFGVGQEPKALLILKPTKLNFQVNEDVEVLILGVPNAQVALILIDSATRELFSDSINLGANGRMLYEIDSDRLSTGSFILNAQRGESIGEARFTVGFTTGSGLISIQTTKDEYRQGESILILGNTATSNVLLDITIIDPTGKTIKKYETYSDQNGFKIDNFRIPIDGETGVWKIGTKSGSNFSQIEFSVLGNSDILILILDKDIYKTNDVVAIEGSGARSASISLKIINSLGEKVVELNITGTNEGKFTTFWQIPIESPVGEYEMIADDGIRNTTTNFTIN
ncbi:MAG: hypothetical protein H8E89_07225 [Candidatus Nitrosopelagicus sp.]|nr:hypothetical protein [Candidatus Nitrosopelagicus sp.]